MVVVALLLMMELLAAEVETTHVSSPQVSVSATCEDGAEKLYDMVRYMHTTHVGRRGAEALFEKMNAPDQLVNLGVRMYDTFDLEPKGGLTDRENTRVRGAFIASACP